MPAVQGELAWQEGAAIRGRVRDTRHSWTEVAEGQLHMVFPFTGDSWSLVLYNRFRADEVSEQCAKQQQDMRMCGVRSAATVHPGATEVADMVLRADRARGRVEVEALWQVEVEGEMRQFFWIDPSRELKIEHVLQALCAWSGGVGAVGDRLRAA